MSRLKNLLYTSALSLFVSLMLHFAALSSNIKGEMLIVNIILFMVAFLVGIPMVFNEVSEGNQRKEGQQPWGKLEDYLPPILKNFGMVIFVYVILVTSISAAIYGNKKYFKDGKVYTKIEDGRNSVSNRKDYEKYKNSQNITVSAFLVLIFYVEFCYFGFYMANKGEKSNNHDSEV